MSGTPARNPLGGPGSASSEVEARRVQIAATVGSATSALTRVIRHRLLAIGWFDTLPAVDKASLGQMIQDVVERFPAWLLEPELATTPGDILRDAPSGMARTVSLDQTVQLIQEAVAVSDEFLPELVASADVDWLTAQVLRYTRSLAFDVAVAYARSAEARGSLGARMEAQFVDAIVRGEEDPGLLSRGSALGLAPSGPVVVMVGAGAPSIDVPDRLIARIGAHVSRLGAIAVAGIHGTELVAVVQLPAFTPDIELRVADIGRELHGLLGAGPLVTGPVVGSLSDAPRSARIAQAAHAASRLAVDPTDVMSSDDLLIERALDGDQAAFDRVHELIYLPLAELGDHMCRTVWTYLDAGGSIQRTADSMFLHPNTVRYRLRKATEATGYLPRAPRDAWAYRIALSVGRARAGATW